jgi:hypothetical protein
VTPRRAALAAAVLFVAVAAVGAAAAPGLHGNHVEVDPQVSADGRVVAESTYLLARGFLVVRADDDGDPGRVLGHSPVLPKGETRLGTTVRIDPGEWRAWSGGRAVWLVLHRDDGDGTFEPGSDPALEGVLGGVAGERVRVAKGERPAAVVAQGIGARDYRNGTVGIPRVSLPADGYVVVSTAPDGGGGEVVSVVGLPAGTYRDVRAPVERGVVARQSERFPLRATLYLDDGDGAFGDADAPVTVGGGPVNTTFLVRRPPGIETVTETPSSTATATETGAGTSTAAATPVRTRTATATTTVETIPESTPGPGASAADDRAATTTGGAGTGPGALVAGGAVVAAVVLAAHLRRRRRRRR